MPRRDPSFRVVLFQRQAGTTHRLARAISSRARVIPVTTEADLLSAVRASADAAESCLVLLEPLDDAGRSTAPLVERLRAEAPHIPLVAYCAPLDAEQAGMHLLARAGIHGLVLEGVDDAAAVLWEQLEAAACTCAAERARGAMRALSPSAMHEVIDCVCAYPARVHALADVARMLGRHRQTFVYHARQTGSESPGSLVRWTRLLIVAALLEHRGRTVESIARLVGYPSATALRNLLRRETGLRAQELRARGPFATVLALVRTSLASAAAVASGVMVA